MTQASHYLDVLALRHLAAHLRATGWPCPCFDGTPVQRRLRAVYLVRDYSGGAMFPVGCDE